MTKTISVAKLRENIGEIIDEVHFLHKRYVITKNNKQYARIIPYGDITPEFEKHLEEFTKEHDAVFRKLASL